MYKQIVDFIKNLYPNENPVPLHAPRFIGKEKEYLNNCIDTTYVSYVGEYVNKFEELVKDFTKTKYSIAIVNGTSAIFVCLKCLGVSKGDEIITQPLTFIGAVNPIVYCNADPIFIDIDKNTLGLSHVSLEEFLHNNTIIKDDGYCYNKITNKRIFACLPVHVFGHPVNIDNIIKICRKNNIEVIEDATESLGTFYKGKHTGTFAKIGILSFNGNKIVTTGGGGMILTDDEELAKHIQHITTTAKVPHKWEYIHDQVGYNYRMPNINAAIGCAQMEKIDFFIKNKRELANLYKDFFDKMDIEFFSEPENSISNYWLNSIILKNKKEKEEFLRYSNENGIITRSVWRLMNKLVMFKNTLTSRLDNANYFEERIVNIPSSVRV